LGWGLSPLAAAVSGSDGAEIDPGFDVCFAPDFALAEGGDGFREVIASGDLVGALAAGVAEHCADFVCADQTRYEI
jgi:hypothetical protein